MTSIRVARRLAGVYWRLWSPVTLGTRVLAVNASNEVLLCRHTYGPPVWHMPGGGVRRRETLRDAALRELREETGVDAVQLEGLLGVYTSFLEGKSDHIVVFTARTTATCARAASPEIAEAGFFDADRLPDDVSAATARRLAEYRGVPPDTRW